MDLNEFKIAWQKASSDRASVGNLDAAKLDEMLRRRGTGIISRLDRSVKIGIWFLVIFLCLTLADQLMPARLLFPKSMEASLQVPWWINLLEWMVNFILMFTILLFVVRYKKLQVHKLADQNMKEAIKKILKLLDTFQKEFYLAVIILMSGIGLGFISGVHRGFESIQFSQSPSTFSILVVAVCMLILFSLLIGSIFYIFHKGFNLLFGKYRHQLIQSLNELQENEE